MDTGIQELSVTSLAGDTDIGYIKMGSGPALVIVPGALGVAMDWSLVARLLGDRVTCYPIDRRGKGRSDLGAGYSMESEAADVKAVLDAAGPDAALLGHSSGALVALETARRYPMRKLIIYEPPFYYNGLEVDALMARYSAKLEEGGNESAIDLFCRDELMMNDDQIAFMCTTPAWGVLTTLAPTLPEEWKAIWKFNPQVKDYADLAMPVLFLTGSMTEDNPSYATNELVELLPDARKVVMPGNGHMAHLGAPEMVAEEIVKFLIG
ncbi:MAG: alpha/beta hydrolase [Actinobacteria bacterium]|nr:alpha/beta hydrolase [Actinomycetota bacterium]